MIFTGEFHLSMTTRQKIRFKRWMWRLEKTLNSKILAPSGAFLLPVIQMNRAQRADAHSNIGSDDL